LKIEKISFCGEIGAKNCTALNSFLKLSLVFIFIHGQDFGTFFLIEMFIGLSVTSPANPGDYRLVLIWLVEVIPLLTNFLLPFFMHKYLKVFYKDNPNLVFKTKI
jgi:hypothetical protein